MNFETPTNHAKRRGTRLLTTGGILSCTVESEKGIRVVVVGRGKTEVWIGRTGTAAKFGHKRVDDVDERGLNVGQTLCHYLVEEEGVLPEIFVDLWYSRGRVVERAVVKGVGVGVNFFRGP